MRKATKIVYSLSMLACLGGIFLHWMQGDSIIWPAIALLWCMNAFLTEYKTYNDE